LLAFFGYFSITVKSFLCRRKISGRHDAKHIKIDALSDAMATEMRQLLHKRAINEEIHPVARTEQQVSNVPDAVAREQVMALLAKFKAMGKTSIDVIDVQHHLRLPLRQIGEIMRRLERERMVKQS
jgi:membrane glycosyltransferase